MGMEVFATLAGAAIQGQIVGRHHAKRTLTCSLQNGTGGPSGNHTDDIFLQNTVRHRKYPFTIVSSTLTDIVEVSYCLWNGHTYWLRTIKATVFLKSIIQSCVEDNMLSVLSKHIGPFSGSVVPENAVPVQRMPPIGFKYHIINHKMYV